LPTALLWTELYRNIVKSTVKWLSVDSTKDVAASPAPYARTVARRQSDADLEAYAPIQRQQAERRKWCDSKKDMAQTDLAWAISGVLKVGLTRFVLLLRVV
jgi:hypothetical protein